MEDFLDAVEAKAEIMCEKNCIYLRFSEKTLRYMLENPTLQAAIPVDNDMVRELLGPSN